MFEKKVGSDACLVLTGEVNLTEGTIILDQKFTLDDLKEALQTRVVATNLAIADYSGATINGIIIATGSSGFRLLGTDTDGVPFTAVFTWSDLDEHWAASLL